MSNLLLTKVSHQHMLNSPFKKENTFEVFHIDKTDLTDVLRLKN